MQSTKAVYAGSCAVRMGASRETTENDSQSVDDLTEASRAGVHPLPFTMGVTCRKSPMPMKGIPPNGASFLMMSWHTVLTQSNQAMFVAGSSSHAISVLALMSCALKENGWMEDWMAMLFFSALLNVLWP
jgi:hypothetical protein